MEDDTADPMFRFVQKGKVGYIDFAGKVAIRASLPNQGTFGDEFHEGLLAVREKDGTRYLDRSGKMVFRTPAYGRDFSEERAPASVDSEGSKYGFIDRTGRFVISATYHEVGGFSEGLARAWNEGFKQGPRMRYIDKQGKVAIPLALSSGTDFHEGRAAVILGACRSTGCGYTFAPTVPGVGIDCRWSYIDHEGRIISPLRFDAAGDFSEGLAAVEISGLWGYIDREGRIAIKPQFEDAMEFSESLAAVRKKGQWGFINHAGVFVITPRFESAGSFSDGRARVIEKVEEAGYYIDKSGKQVFAGDFRWATGFRHGLAHVQLKDGRYAYINTSGKALFIYRDR